MLEDGPLLSGMLTAEKEEDKAYFYLCGPTWPVPDVYAALVGSLEKNQSMEKTKAEAYIEELKEAERYVLEVY
jgi:sulfite reductase (NADPH) flavoprotein alpha-component